MRRLRRPLVVLGAAALMSATMVTGASAQDESKPAVVRDGAQWHLRDTLSGGPATTTFWYGRIDDSQHMLRDWNGDGTPTPGVIRWEGNNPRWLLRNSNSGGPADHSFIYGREGDRAVCGDWNGNGQQTPGIVRERDDGLFQWHLRNSVSGGPADRTFYYGRDLAAGELPPTFPIVGDWNGDGVDTVGIVRGHEDGQMQWLLRNANRGGVADLDFYYYDGAVWGDHMEIHVPIVGDWNGDGQDGPGVTRASGPGSPQWLLRNDRSAGHADHVFYYGGSHMERTLTWR